MTFGNVHETYGVQGLRSVVGSFLPKCEPVPLWRSLTFPTKLGPGSWKCRKNRGPTWRVFEEHKRFEQTSGGSTKKWYKFVVNMNELSKGIRLSHRTTNSPTRNLRV